MLKLSIDREPFWLDVMPAVRIRLRPVTVASILAARAAAADALRAGGADAQANAAFAFTRTLARFGIVQWEGIGDKDGNPIAPTPETIDAALECWPIFDAIDRLYVAPVLLQADEKNA
ncbi:MAG TPA: hypothetical protein VNK48_07295 [Xanthobacteraceae bacterium]|nr:hypothetical protein [Xanthobacteraceae bacterium]